jgi:hypothetical protein
MHWVEGMESDWLFTSDHLQSFLSKKHFSYAVGIAVSKRQAKYWVTHSMDKNMRSVFFGNILKKNLGDFGFESSERCSTEGTSTGTATGRQ